MLAQPKTRFQFARRRHAHVRVLQFTLGSQGRCMSPRGRAEDDPKFFSVLGGISFVEERIRICDDVLRLKIE